MKNLWFAVIFGNDSLKPNAEAGPLPFESPLYDWRITGPGTLAKAICDRAMTADVIGEMPKTVAVPRSAPNPSVWAREFGFHDLPPAVPVVTAAPAAEPMDFRKGQHTQKTQADHRKQLGKLIARARATFPGHGDGWDRVLDSAAAFVHESVRLFA